MTDKTPFLLRLNTAEQHFLLLVAFGAVIHFHAIPGVFLDPDDILSPDVPAIACDPVLLIQLHMLGFTDGAMTGRTVHIG